MAKVDQAAPVAVSDTGGLRRDVGLIGLMWASVGSIIGSGWLYGAEKAVVVAGPAAIISWVIGTVAIVLLALVHAELGGMFPVAGGTARYPHYAFGGLAGMSFGWFSWLQAATVAPIEVEAMIGYAGHWKFAQGLQDADGTLTTSGVVTAIVLMAVFVGVNFFGVRAWRTPTAPRPGGRSPSRSRRSSSSPWATSTSPTSPRRLRPLRRQGHAGRDQLQRHHLRAARLRAGDPAGR